MTVDSGDVAADWAMPAVLWKIADELCCAGGALVAEHNALAQAEQDYRDRCRTQRRQAWQAVAQARAEALRTQPASVVRAATRTAPTC